MSTLEPLPEGFPTPEPGDPPALAQELGTACGRWMRGAYEDAVARLHAAALVAAQERAPRARVEQVRRAATSLGQWVDDQRTDPHVQLAAILPHPMPASPPVTPPAPPNPPPPDATSAPRRRAWTTTLGEARRPEPAGSERDRAGVPPAPLPPRRAFGATLQTGAPAARAAPPPPPRGLEPDAARAHANAADAADVADAAEETDESITIDVEEPDPWTRPTSDAPVPSQAPTRRHVPPSTRRPAAGEVYPPAADDADDDDTR